MKNTFEKSLGIVRIYNVIKNNKAVSYKEITEKAFVSYSVVEKGVAELKSCGLCYVSGTKRLGNGGSPIKLISFGNKKDVQHKRVVLDKEYRAKKRKKYKNDTIINFGEEAYKKLLQGYQGRTSSLVISGKKIWQRGERRKKCYRMENTATSEPIQMTSGLNAKPGGY